MSGLELSERFHRTAVAPLLDGVPHAAALLGDGSEVLGFDDDVSPDHDFGPRCQVFVRTGAQVAPVLARLDALPERFEGRPVRFAYHGGPVRHQVEVTTPGEFFRARIGVDPATGMGLADWLLTPTQRLATLSGGRVFADPEGLLAPRRAALAWYPEDVWRYALASAWLRIGQEETFIGRTGARGDELGSAVLAARLVRDLMRLAFLVERVWAPYGKWLGTAFARLELAGALTPHLAEALNAVEWRTREAAVCEAGAVLAEATNALGLAPRLDARPHAFHTRDIKVVGGERFTEALAAAVTDRDVRGLLERLGRRGNDPVGRLPGTIDQAVDSTDVLSSVDRCRASAGVLGLG